MSYKPWSTSETAFLRKNAHKGTAYIAEHLMRSKSSVRTQASRLGIPLGAKWTLEELEKLSKLDGKSAEKIQTEIVKSIEDIAKAAQVLGVACGIPGETCPQCGRQVTTLTESGVCIWCELKDKERELQEGIEAEEAHYQAELLKVRNRMNTRRKRMRKKYGKNPRSK